MPGTLPTKAPKLATNGTYRPIAEAIAAGVAAVATVVLGTFAGIQLRAYNAQTRVLLASFRANARMARAAQRSAKAAEDAVSKSDEILSHSIEANELSRNAMIADQRPWLRVDEVFASDEMTFGSQGFALPLKFKMVNSGKSPAQRIHLFPYLVVTGGAFEATKELQKLRARAPRTESLVETTCLFPGDEIEPEHFMCPTMEKLLAIPENSAGIRILALAIYGYVIYQTDFDTKVRQTGFVFDIDFIRGPFLIRDSKLPDTPVGAQHINITKWPRGWFAT
jgi:hypothetical protein